MTMDDATEVIARYESGDLNASAVIDEFRAAVVRGEDGDPAEVRDRLLTLVHEGEYGVRSTAAALLATFAEEHPSSVAAVASSLSAPLDDDFPIPERTLAALDHVAQHDPGSAVPVVDDVTSFLDDDEEQIRQRAADVLAHIARERPEVLRPHVEALSQLLRTPTIDDGANRGTYAISTSRGDRPGRANPADEEVALLREQGAGVGVRIHSTTRDSVGVALSAVAAADPDAVADVLPDLREAIRDGDTSIRRSIFDVFSSLADSDPAMLEPVVGDIVTVLQDERDAATRTIGVHVLATLVGDGFDVVDHVKPAIPTLVSDLRADDPSTRVGAATLLSYVAERDPAPVMASIDPLVEALHDDEPAVRISAVWALAALPRSAAREHLADAAESDPHPEVRALASDRLGEGTR